MESAAAIAAILLVAGESRRMGSLKALLPWQGSTLLAHQISSLRQAGVDPVVVVLGHEAGRLKPEVEGKEGVVWRVNPDYWQGKTTSIKVGLNALGPGKPSAVLILNVDQPRSADTIEHLLQQHREGGRSITIPRYRGKGGHPIVVDSALLEELNITYPAGAPPDQSDAGRFRGRPQHPAAATRPVCRPLSRRSC